MASQRKSALVWRSEPRCEQPTSAADTYDVRCGVCAACRRQAEIQGNYLGEFVAAYLLRHGWTSHEDRTWTHDNLKPANPHVGIGQAVSHQIMFEESAR